MPVFKKQDEWLGQKIQESLHLADLKLDFLSDEPERVMAAIDRVKNEGLPSLYDDIVYGVDADSLYDGDSKTIGDFQESKSR